MSSQMLEKAREYEKVQGDFVAKQNRPDFHLSSRIGWMNDPNGFSVYKNEYHMFYQYHPYSTNWGPMHWGHAVSKDFIHWDYLPVALAPDTPQDEVGCFSGSAIELKDGRQLLLYTGVAKEVKEDGTTQDIQTQCVAVGDGVDYIKYHQNPVLDAEDIPDGFSKFDFRDPKIWQEEDGTYRCVVVNRTGDQSGAVLLYESEDAFHWTYLSTLDRCHNQYGLMWECPDYFTLDGKQVLLISPQEMQAQGTEFHSGNNTMCLIGEFDSKTNTFVRQNVHAIDYGIDFYATQTLLAPDGRRIMSAWMQSWDATANRIPDCKWYGQMILPRELHIKDGRLIQNPVRELESIRGARVSYSNQNIQDSKYLDQVSGRKVDMTVTVNAESEYDVFRIKVAQNDEFDTMIEYNPKTSMLKLDRTRSGCRVDIVHERSCSVRNLNGAIKLRIVMDLYSVEVFVNDGEQAMTACIYTTELADGISFEAIGTAIIDVEKYDLKA